LAFPWASAHHSKPAQLPAPRPLPVPPVRAATGAPSPPDPPRQRRPGEGIRLAPPRRLGLLASHSPTCHSPSLSLARSALLSSRSVARAPSPPFSIVVAATGGPTPADLVGDLRHRPLHRLVASAGDGEHRSVGSPSSSSAGRRTPSSLIRPPSALPFTHGASLRPHGEHRMSSPCLPLVLLRITSPPWTTELSSAVPLIVVASIDAKAVRAHHRARGTPAVRPNALDRL